MDALRQSVEEDGADLTADEATLLYAELDAVRARLAEVLVAAQDLTRSLREEEWVQNGGGSTVTHRALAALESVAR